MSTVHFLFILKAIGRSIREAIIWAFSLHCLDFLLSAIVEPHYAIVLSLVEGDQSAFFVGPMIQSAIGICLGVWVNYNYL